MPSDSITSALPLLLLTLRPPCLLLQPASTVPVTSVVATGTTVPVVTSVVIPTTSSTIVVSGVGPDEILGGRPSELPDLRLGDSGDQVLRLRAALRLLGFESADDDRFDSELQTLVLSFQATAGLVRDGVVGPRTWTAVSEALATVLNVESVITSPPTTVAPPTSAPPATVPSTTSSSTTTTVSVSVTPSTAVATPQTSAPGVSNGELAALDGLASALKGRVVLFLANTTNVEEAVSPTLGLDTSGRVLWRRPVASPEVSIVRGGAALLLGIAPFACSSVVLLRRRRSQVIERSDVGSVEDRTTSEDAERIRRDQNPENTELSDRSRRSTDVVDVSFASGPAERTDGPHLAEAATTISDFGYVRIGSALYPVERIPTGRDIFPGEVVRCSYDVESATVDMRKEEDRDKS